MKKNKTILAAAMICALTLTLGPATGCAAAGTTGTTASAATVSTATASTAAASTAAASTARASSSTTAAVSTAAAQTDASGLIDTEDLFSDRDLTQTADTTGAVSYTVTDGQNITITEAGVYILSGTAKNVTVTVNTTDEDAKVQLVLNGVSITNSNAPAIYVVSADKCFITTASGTTNTLSVTGTFTADGTTNTDAVIFSKSDLVLNGTGTLTISSTANGITSKDDLKVTGGTYNITSTKDSLEANDSIAICGGTFTINSSKDGLHCENSDDKTGYIYISGGTFTITAADDGIQGTTVVEINGGTFTIKSAEGIEGTYVLINDGTISISASDDGINAASKSSACSVVIEINGGNITIVMGSGDTDAVDANGSIYVNGGNINITGNSAFDYDVTGQLNGGTVIVNGSQITQMTNQMMGGGNKGGMR